MYHEQELVKIRQAMESWEKGSLRKQLDTVEERKKEFTTVSGIPVRRLYTPLDLSEKGWNYVERLGFPGEYPFTRGMSPTMYRSNLWRMYQYAGYGTADSTNKWYKYLLDQGAQELAMALDLPTQIGYDSDNPLCRGEVGKVGVSVDSLADMETIFDGIPIENIHITTVGSAIGPIFLAWLIALAEKRHIPPQKLRISIQGDILREIVSRGTQIFPVRPSVKCTCDFIEYGVKNGLSLEHAYCGYHMREAGANAIQEMAFTLANAVEYTRELVSRGIKVDELPRPRVIFVGGIEFFEEICKSRAFRRMFARVMKEKFNAKNPEAMVFTLQFGSQSSLYTSQQPLNNIIRGAIIALVEALSGGETNSVARYTEALSIPTPESATISLRTQQIIAYETGIADTVDPLGGSYYVETLTDELEEKATQLFEQVEAMGGAIAAIERGFIQREIAKSAYEDLRQVESGGKVRVGVNIFQVDEPTPIKLMRVDPSDEERQIQKVRRLRKERGNDRVESNLKELEQTALEGINLVPPILAAVRSYATIGEICDVLRGVFGEYKETWVL